MGPPVTGTFQVIQMYVVNLLIAIFCSSVVGLKYLLHLDGPHPKNWHSAPPAQTQKIMRRSVSDNRFDHSNETTQEKSLHVLANQTHREDGKS